MMFNTLEGYSYEDINYYKPKIVGELFLEKLFLKDEKKAVSFMNILSEVFIRIYLPGTSLQDKVIMIKGNLHKRDLVSEHLISCLGFYFLTKAPKELKDQINAGNINAIDKVIEEFINKICRLDSKELISYSKDLLSFSENFYKSLSVHFKKYKDFVQEELSVQLDFSDLIQKDFHTWGNFTYNGLKIFPQILMSDNGASLGLFNTDSKLLAYLYSSNNIKLDLPRFQGLLALNRIRVFSDDVMRFYKGILDIKNGGFLSQNKKPIIQPYYDTKTKTYSYYIKILNEPLKQSFEHYCFQLFISLICGESSQTDINTFMNRIEAIVGQIKLNDAVVSDLPIDSKQNVSTKEIGAISEKISVISDYYDGTQKEYSETFVEDILKFISNKNNKKVKAGLLGYDFMTQGKLSSNQFIKVYYDKNVTAVKLIIYNNLSGLYYPALQISINISESGELLYSEKIPDSIETLEKQILAYFDDVVINNYHIKAIFDCLPSKNMFIKYVTYGFIEMIHKTEQFSTDEKSLLNYLLSNFTFSDFNGKISEISSAFIGNKIVNKIPRYTVSPISNDLSMRDFITLLDSLSDNRVGESKAVDNSNIYKLPAFNGSDYFDSLQRYFTGLPPDFLYEFSDISIEEMDKEIDNLLSNMVDIRNYSGNLFIFNRLFSLVDPYKVLSLIDSIGVVELEAILSTYDKGWLIRKKIRRHLNTILSKSKTNLHYFIHIYDRAFRMGIVLDLEKLYSVFILMDADQLKSLISNYPMDMEFIFMNEEFENIADYIRDKLFKLFRSSFNTLYYQVFTEHSPIRKYKNSKNTLPDPRTKELEFFANPFLVKNRVAISNARQLFKRMSKLTVLSTYLGILKFHLDFFKFFYPIDSTPIKDYKSRIEYFISSVLVLLDNLYQILIEKSKSFGSSTTEYCKNHLTGLMSEYYQFGAKYGFLKSLDDRILSRVSIYKDKKLLKGSISERIETTSIRSYNTDTMIKRERTNYVERSIQRKLDGVLVKLGLIKLFKTLNTDYFSIEEFELFLTGSSSVFLKLFQHMFDKGKLNDFLCVLFKNQGIYGSEIVKNFFSKGMKDIRNSIRFNGTNLNDSKTLYNYSILEQIGVVGYLKNRESFAQSNSSEKVEFINCLLEQNPYIEERLLGFIKDSSKANHSRSIGRLSSNIKS